MSDIRIGLLHPGEMGAAVGRCLTGRGIQVRWASAGRGAATAARADAAGLTDAGTIAELASGAGVLLSICPPHAAVAVAREVASAGFGGLYVDANAVAPATAQEISGIVTAAGAAFTDGGIIGLPPGPDDSGGTRLYLAGGRAGEVAELFAGTALDARIVSGDAGPAPAGAASALKMSYAAWTKGTSALLLAIRALAQAEGVEDALLAEWSLSQPDLPARSVRAARTAAAKGWRWIGEMDEISASMTARDLPGGFHQAAAEIYRRYSGDLPAGGDSPEAGESSAAG